MKNCRNCKEGEAYCECDDPSFISDGMVLMVGFTLLVAGIVGVWSLF